MAYTPAVRPTTNRLLRALRQQEAVSGRRLDPEQIRAIVEAGYGAEADRGLARAEFAEGRRRFDEAMDLKREALEAEERAAAISGAVNLGALGYEMFSLAPRRIATQEAHTQAIRDLTTSTLGGPAVTAAPSTDVATGAAAGGGGAATATTTGASTVAKIGGGIGATIVGKTAGRHVGEGKGSVLAGAAAGAALGSVLPGVGTVAGGILGGLGAMDDTVICTELHRQGVLPTDIWRLDGAYARHIGIEVHIGYQMLTASLVKKMKTSKFVMRCVTPFGLAWAYTMANKIDPSVKLGFGRKILGHLILVFGVPVCRWKGRKAIGGLCHG